MSSMVVALIEREGFNGRVGLELLSIGCFSDKLHHCFFLLATSDWALARTQLEQAFVDGQNSHSDLPVWRAVGGGQWNWTLNCIDPPTV